jgi:hypothetical protein
MSLRSVLDRLRHSAVWLGLLRALNGIAASLFGGVVLLNIAYPQAVTELGGDLPSWAKITGAILWFALVDYSLRRARDGK